MFVRRSIPPIRLSTQGGRFRAPLRSPRSATPESKVPRLSSSWLARRDPVRIDRLRQASPDASGRLMQPTLSKTSTHAPAVSGLYPGTGSAAGPRASMTPGPLLPADPAPAPSVLDSSRRDGAGVWRLVTTRGNGALTRARVTPGDQDRFRHRSIERRWFSRSETPSVGWKPLPSPRRSRRNECARFERRRPFTRRVFASG